MILAPVFGGVSEVILAGNIAFDKIHMHLSEICTVWVVSIVFIMLGCEYGGAFNCV